jgi:non-ribosomal peptide synthetase-like protein
MVQGAHVVGDPVKASTAELAESAFTRRGGAGLTIGTERLLAETLADVMHVEHVSADSHFFDDLGADSLVMAHFCARVRKRPDLPSVSMRDIYQYPTISSLVTALMDAETAAAETTPVQTTPVESSATSTDIGTPAGMLSYVLCGTLQFSFFLGYCYLVALVAARAYKWISTGSGIFDVYLRSVLFGGGTFLALCILPILAKWLLIGRWKPQEIRIWSLAYVRFWIVKTLVRSNPLAFLFAGSPLYVLYLRALGAKIGRGVAILSPTVPVCTDLLTIGTGTVIRKDSYFLCYRAQAAQIQTGTVTIGRNAFIGEKTVLDINTSVGDRAQLGHTSSLYSGQKVPHGEAWHGSPAQRTELNYLRVTPRHCSSLRGARYCAFTLLCLFFVYLPLAYGGVYILLAKVPSLAKLNLNTGALTSWELYATALVLSLVVFFGATLVGLVVAVTVPRVLNLFIKPGTVYPLYGFHFRIHRTITRLTSVKFFTQLFGDSSYIVYYLRCLGYDLSHVEQTGSNFGTEVAHETPYLSSVGTGTMVADGLSLMNADFSNTSFRVSRVSIGPHNFVGNAIAYPADGRTGSNCLLATKVMIPLDGEVREGIGLLGSPCFEIPRSVERDSRFDHYRTADELRGRLAAKNRYNIRSMGIFLLTRWLHVFLITVLGLAAVALYGALAQAIVAAIFALSVVVSAAYFVLLERSIAAFRTLQPQYCSIYDRYFWRHERIWKVPEEAYLHIFDGTPFKNIIWRLLGVRLGRRVFDDGCFLTERTLATIGDDCTLNAGSKIQCHSQEDGTFKSDRSTIGAGCTLGVGAMVHYGVTMGSGSMLAPDSFLMKGEEIPPGGRWGGNPAREM